MDFMRPQFSDVPRSGIAMELCFDIYIQSVLGAIFVQKVYPFDTVADLKNQVARYARMDVTRLALVFAGRELQPDTAVLSSFNIKADSTIRLVPVARAGPSRTIMQPAISRTDSYAISETERSLRGCSAPEDTSAKESSAGELTEHDEVDRQHRLTRLAGVVYSGRHPRRQRINSISAYKFAEAATREEALPLLECTQDKRSSEDAEDDDLCDGALVQPESDGLLNVSDVSELSSGMIICDLSNEFRKVKVRRRHHNGVPGRARSRPRRKGGSSSDEREGEVETDDAPELSTLPQRRQILPQKTRQMSLKSVAQQRCSVCAFKMTTMFNCRCGKSLCSRHRAAQAHPCNRTRRVQQVSE